MLRDLMESICWSVSQLNQYVLQLFQKDEVLQNVIVKGEISGFTQNKSGHLYFTLKDSSAAVRCVMFRPYAQKLGFLPENGMEVKVYGNVSLYQRDGAYQINVRAIEKGRRLGDLYAEFLQRKETLEAEGLFRAEHKREIPRFPRRIGVVTSRTGAVIQDIIHVSTRRNPGVRILLAPASVQGTGAVKEMIAALDRLDRVEDVDVIILGRGGGSMEDLFVFNDETLARAIYKCNTPVVSAVGHETDYTIADFVADFRAPTPSAAAELCTPLLSQIEDSVCALCERMRRNISQRYDEITRQYAYLIKTVAFRRIADHLYECLQSMDRLQRELSKELLLRWKNIRSRVAILEERLNASHPYRPLSRGYAFITTDQPDGYLSSVRNVKLGQMAHVHFADGIAEIMFTGSIKEGDAVEKE